LRTAAPAEAGASRTPARAQSRFFPFARCTPGPTMSPSRCSASSPGASHSPSRARAQPARTKKIRRRRPSRDDFDAATSRSWRRFSLSRSSRVPSSTQFPICARRSPQVGPGL
jgi:hypothetical protein